MSKLNKCLLLLLGWLLIIPSLFAQQGPRNYSKIVRKIDNHFRNDYREKVYLHADRSTYISGDNIWFKAYLVEGQFHLRSNTSRLLTVELIDPQKKVLFTRQIKMVNGTGNGDFNLPKKLLTGDYMIRAYTRYMRNFEAQYFFHKKLRVLNISDKKAQQEVNEAKSQKASRKSRKKNSKVIAITKSQKPIDLQFFPEGGIMVSQLANFVAFKAINSEGKGVAISGEIIDENGTLVGNFMSQKFGLGKFILVPETGRKYKAKIIYDGKTHQYDLPLALPKGYLLRVKNTKKNIRIAIENNLAESLKGAMVVAHVRGTVLSKHLFQTEKSATAISIPVKNIPSGILHITFFDPQGQPRCERLVFVENPKDVLKVDIRSETDRYGLRTKTEFEVLVKDNEGKPVKTDFSMAAVRGDFEAAPGHKMNIQNYMWLKSDLKGYIENPAYYFNPKNEDRHEMMDLLMMTHGWRKFKWQDVLQGKTKQLRYAFQKGFDISGRLVNFYNRGKSSQGKVTLGYTKNLSDEYQQMTSEDGRFIFKDIDINEPIDFILQTKKPTKTSQKKRILKKIQKKKLKEKHVVAKNDMKFISIDRWRKAAFGAGLKQASDYTISEQNNRQLLNRTRDMSSINIVNGLEKDITMLDEVQVTARKYTPLQFYTLRKSDQQLILDSMAGVLNSKNLFEYLEDKIPGVIVYNSGHKAYLKFSSTSSGDYLEPMYFIDGQLASRAMVRTVPVNAVSHVDVVRHGIIVPILQVPPVSYATLAIYTFRDKLKIRRARWGVINMRHPGYYKSRKFYIPNYQKKSIRNNKTPDLRRILYWNPSITTNQRGVGKISFYTSDEEAFFRLELEGIAKGKILLGSFDFEVSNQE